jgi:hypothetical protein
MSHQSLSEMPVRGFPREAVASLSAADVLRALGPDGDSTEVTCCCVLFNAETGENEAFAVVDRADIGGREVTTANGWCVFLLPPDAPLSVYLRGRRPGDVLGDVPGAGDLFPDLPNGLFLCYRVVSIEHGPAATAGAGR